MLDNQTFWQFFEDRAALLVQNLNEPPIDGVKQELVRLLAETLVEGLWKALRDLQPDLIGGLLEKSACAVSHGFPRTIKSATLQWSWPKRQSDLCVSRGVR